MLDSGNMGCRFRIYHYRRARTIKEREEIGFSCVVVGAAFADALAPVVAERRTLGPAGQSIVKAEGDRNRNDPAR